jgi:asparagine synthase (glutamine-hydrolysing)
MAGVLSHRGPDDTGLHLGPGYGLGFRRLAIVDLAGGRQPMHACDARIVSICNGEIYNHRELRRELTARGCALRTACDVEVIPHLYELDGPDFVGRLNGQFALAIVDERRRELLLARDHVGIAPLFYTVLGDTLLFASEIKALLRHPAVPRAVDLTGLDQNLTWPGPVSPRTLFQGIRSLPPGHRLRFSERGLHVERYWDLDYPRDEETCLSEADCVDLVEEALRQAVRDRLQADVPVGFYLSGGLDSSLIAALIHEMEPDHRRHSFSITFPDGAIDERAYQRLMAGRVGSIHHEREVDPPAICGRLREIVRLAETPLRESYNACSLILSGLAREHGLKVIQTGEGADEIFGGYVGYRLDQQRPNEVEDDDLEELLEAQTRRRIFGDGGLFYEKSYRALGDTKSALYSRGVVERFAEVDCLREPPVDLAQLAGRHRFHQRSYLDFKLRLADHLLADHGDRVAYAHSVEVRYPFLDVRVIEAAKRIPPALMVKDGEEKYVLRRLAERYLPPAILERRKFSFVAPGSPHLLRHGIEGDGEVSDLLSPERIRRQGYFNPETVERLKRRAGADGFEINQTYEDDLLMVVLTFGIFLEEFGLPDLQV